jgi:hypothetical protein
MGERSITVTALALASITASVAVELSAPAIRAADPPPAHKEVPRDPWAPRPPQPRSDPDQPRSMFVRGPFRSVQVNVDDFGHNIWGDAANEPSIAVDPTNSDRIVIGWRQFDSVSSDFRQAGWAYSHDGGSTWTFPGVLEPGIFRSDPVLAADADGTVFYNSLTVAGSTYSCDVFKSSDGGVSWQTGVYAFGGDKPWMTIDWTDGIGQGNIYCAWSRAAGCCGRRTFNRSTDGGQTFSEPVEIPSTPTFGTLAVAPDGELYIAGIEAPLVPLSAITVAKSSNAQDPDAETVFDFASSLDLGGAVTGWDGPNPIGLLGQVWVACDHSDGPTRGNVYLLCSVDPPDDDPLDVHFVRSTDGGVSWSSPVRINDDLIEIDAWQWFGTMSVAPNGRIDVIWNDTRHGPWWVSELYYSYSTDAGVTWSVNVPVSQMFDSSVGYPGGNDKLGDYYDMISDDAGANVAYAATFNGEQDVYFLRIHVDCNGNGIPDVEEIAAGTSHDCNGNGIPDACDLASAGSDDCNSNGTPDECDGVDLRESKRVASDAVADQGFGGSVSISGPVAVIGAYGDNHAGAESGSAYVFRNTGGHWVQEAKLTADDAAANDRFGYSVAVSGDVALIGAYADEPGGSAYVFRYDGSAWVQEARLTADDAAAGDQFGFSVAVNGNVAAIGAYAKEPGGSAYVFRYDGSGWAQEAKLTADDAAGGDGFGSSVSIDGPVAVIGAPYDDGDAFDTGSAYVFRHNATVWDQESKLTAVDGFFQDLFGASVSVSGDVALIGALHLRHGLTSAYVFRHTASTWLMETTLIGSDTERGDRFGYAVSISGDVAIAGAFGDDDAGGSSGSAYLFRRGAWGWLQEAKLTASDAAGGDFFGVSVCVSGDSAFVGAPGENAAGDDAGAVYIYDRRNDCNTNGVLDECDIAAGTSQDFDGNGIPDECPVCGDLTGEGQVDDADFATFLAAYGRSQGEPQYNPACDLDGDGTVTIVDYQMWLQCYRDFVGDSSAAPPAGARGDFDADGDIDLADFAWFQGCLPTPPERSFACAVKFDFNEDGQVDILDWEGFQAAVTGP